MHEIPHLYNNINIIIVTQSRTGERVNIVANGI